MTVAEKIAVVPFLVYGVVGHPLDLTLEGMLTVTGHRPSVTLRFMSSRYPSCPVKVFSIGTFDVVSRPALNALPLSDDPSIERMIQEQELPVKNPFLWEGALTIAATLFSGTIRYYTSPLQIFDFRFKSEETLLNGNAYGPSCDEVIGLLEGLQVLNGRDEVIRQYDEPRDL